VAPPVCDDVLAAPPVLVELPLPVGPLLLLELHAKMAVDAMIAPNGSKICILIETSKKGGPV
jgi:hypothetical protein